MKNKTSLAPSYIGIVCGAILIIMGLVILTKADLVDANGKILGEYYYIAQYLSKIISRCGILVAGIGTATVCVCINQMNIIKQVDDINDVTYKIERLTRETEFRIEKQIEKENNLKKENN